MITALSVLMGCGVGPDGPTLPSEVTEVLDTSTPGDTAVLPTVPSVIEVPAGPLDRDVTWSPAAGTYRVLGEVVVPDGVTLTLAPGTVVWFTEGAQLTVHGVLRAEGLASLPIQLTADPDAAWVPDLHPLLPDGPPHWLGVQFIDSGSPDNVLSHVQLAYAQNEFGAVGLVQSEAVLEHLLITGTRRRMIYSDASSLIVRDSTFPAMFTEDDSADALGLNNDTEFIKGIGGIPADGHYLVQGNVFGVNKGHNDVIDFDSNLWPEPILQVRDNLFLGAGDEGIDGGGDFLLDGNTFVAFIKDADNHGSGDSNCTTTGDTATTLMVATRNVYVGVDHVVNLKRGSFGYFEHNTVVGISASRPSLPGDTPPRTLLSSAIHLLIPHVQHPVDGPPRDPPGRGAYLEGMVFADVPERIFGNPDLDPPAVGAVSLLEVHRTLLADPELVSEVDGVHGREFDLVVGTPSFRDVAGGDYGLVAGSVGTGAGRHGLDLGADVPPGATVCCAPAGPSSQTTLTVEVGGPGIFAFQHRVDGGPWSDDIEIADPRQTLPPIRRTASLEVGPVAVGGHLLEVRGRDFAGVLQADATALSWTVDP